MIELNPQLVTEWGIQKKKLDESKKAEMRLRKEICNAIFEGQQGKFYKKHEITVDGVPLELKAESKTKLKLDEPILSTLELSIEEEGCFERDVIKMSDAKVRKLASDSCVWSAITEEPSAPALTFKKVE